MLVTLPRMVGNYICEQLPPVVEAIKDLVGCRLLELRAEKNGISEMGLSDIFRFEASCAYT